MDFSEGKTVVEMIREKYNQIFMAERKVESFWTAIRSSPGRMTGSLQKKIISGSVMMTTLT